MEKEMDSDPTKLPYYHESISREEAESIVLSFNGDCFLTRASSRYGCLAMTVKSSYTSQTPVHFLVEEISGGLCIKDSEDTSIYTTFTELVTNSFIVKGCTPVQRSKPLGTVLISLISSDVRQQKLKKTLIATHQLLPFRPTEEEDSQEAESLQCVEDEDGLFQSQAMDSPTLHLHKLQLDLKRQMTINKNLRRRKKLAFEKKLYESLWQQKKTMSKI